MSRSYRKNPVIKDHYGSPHKHKFKRFANDRVRQHQKDGVEIGSGSEFKKHSETWNIHDYAFRCTREQAAAFYNQELEFSKKTGSPSWIIRHYPSLDDFLKQWEKIYKRK